MAFTTILGSGGAPDSFVGTAGVDPIALINSLGNFILTGVGDNDMVYFVGSGNSPAVTGATLKGGDGADVLTNITGEVFNSVELNGNAGNDVLSFGGSIFTGSSVVVKAMTSSMSPSLPTRWSMVIRATTPSP